MEVGHKFIGLSEKDMLRLIEIGNAWVPEKKEKHKKSGRPPGRPKIRTDEERKEMKSEYNRKRYQMMKNS